MADYVIVYFKQGSHLSSSPWRGELEKARIIARDGLLRCGADEWQIRADTVDGPIVCREPRET